MSHAYELVQGGPSDMSLAFWTNWRPGSLSKTKQFVGSFLAIEENHFASRMG